MKAALPATTDHCPAVAGPGGHNALTAAEAMRREAPLWYPQFSWEELGGRFLGLMADLDPKGEGDKSA